MSRYKAAFSPLASLCQPYWQKEENEKLPAFFPVFFGNS